MFRRIKGRLYRALHYDWLSWSRKHCYLYKKIFGEKYSQNYCLKVLYCPDTLIFSEHGYSNTDFNTEHVNVVGGKRLTVGSNNSSSMKIHCFGDSRLYGVGVEDADTFCSLLQKKINERKESATVVNHGILNSCFSNIYNELINTNIQEGDCVFIFLPPQFIHYELYGIPLAASFRMMKKYGTIVAKNIQKFCIDRDVDVFFLKWPDVRLLKFPSRHDRLMQRLVSNVFLKQYVFIPDSEEIDPYLTRKKADMRFIQLDLTDAFNESSDGKDLFWDSSHFGPLGHKIIADRLYAFFEKNLFEKKNKNFIEEKIKEITAFSHERYINNIEEMLTGLTKYYRNITRFNTNGEEKIGCIVMNCNPFTIGHEYIIKHAISLVDYLYIFIVEEDSSMFTFEERLYMVRKSFSMYRNIKIIPSGPLIISAVTFPEYFVKDKLPQNTHAAFDVFFFRRLIVPLFAISVRFVGKEPFCKVTQEYNEQMKKQLPEDGVAVVEIDRLEMEGQAISASHVRRLIQAGDTARLKQLLPPVSYDLVSQRYLIVRSL